MSGRPPRRARTRKSPEPSVHGRPRASTWSRARKGSTAATPGCSLRNATTSSGRSPMTPEAFPAGDLTQRSERRVDSTQTRTVSRIEATVTIIASVMPSARARAVTAIALRASDPPKKRLASRPGSPKSRASGPTNARSAARTRSGETSARDATTSATAAKPKTGKSFTAGAVAAAPAAARRKAAAIARPRSRRCRTLSIEPARSAAAGSTRIASAAGSAAAATAARRPTAPARSAGPVKAEGPIFAVGR